MKNVIKFSRVYTDYPFKKENKSVMFISTVRVNCLIYAILCAVCTDLIYRRVNKQNTWMNKKTFWEIWRWIFQQEITKRSKLYYRETEKLIWTPSTTRIFALRISSVWSYLRTKFLMLNFVFCTDRKNPDGLKRVRSCL